MRTTMSTLGCTDNFLTQKRTCSFTEAQPILGSTISDNGKTAPVPFSGALFTPPLRDKDWSDDSVIE